MKIMYVVNSSSFFCSHFLELAKTAKNNGWDVHIIAGDSEKAIELKVLGFHFYSINLSRKGVNIISEFFSMCQLYKIIKNINPDMLHSFTVKPIVYSGLISRFLLRNNMKCISSITGLGSASLDLSFKGKIVWSIIKFSYIQSFKYKFSKIIFENNDDRFFFIQSKVLTAFQSFVVNGAGINLDIFSPSIEKHECFSIILVARLLKDKGIREYIEAGKVIKERNVPIRLLLAGTVDHNNPSSMSTDEIQEAHDNGYIEYLGFRTDVADLYKHSHVACLPSYREGLPKSLIEAASCGLPIVTTDVPGCRQLVDNHKNGFLIPPRDSNALAECLIHLHRNKDLLDDMGKASRVLAERKFGYDQVLASFFEIYNSAGDFRNE